MRPLLLALLALPLAAQPLTRANVQSVLGFEDSQNGRLSARWGGGTQSEVAADDQVFHAGSYSARITRTATEGFTFVQVAIPQDFQARTLELRGFLKYEEVGGYAALFVRQDGSGSTLAFASLQSQNLKGTADWTEHSVSIQLQPNGRQVVAAFIVGGVGKVWADSLQLLADGKPVAEAPAMAPTVLATDVEFIGGSGISTSAFTPVQHANLAMLAKVWGFAKYHHAAVTSGRQHWDFDLFRVMPAVLAAPNAAAAQATINEWLGRLGPIPDCSPCATLSTTALMLPPDVAWIDDGATLGSALRETLQRIYRQRPVGAKFFLDRTPVGGPLFENELNYPNVRHPDPGYQLLGLFRFWNMMQYFNPNRDIMSDDPAQASAYWSQVLLDFIPVFARATDRVSYQQALLLFIAKINDTHANLWSGISALPPMGACYLPVDVRFVEGQLVVYRRTARDAAAENPLQVGDVITHLNGAGIVDLVNDWRPFYPASNEPTRLRDIARYATRGACGSVPVTIRRGDETLEVRPNRLAIAAIDFTRSSVHDLAGPAFQKLSDDVAYLKLSSVRAADSANYIRQATGTKGLIIDIRNYPSEFVVFTLGQLLVDQPTQFVRFSEVDLANPGAFHLRAGASLTPQAPRYTGKVVILIDEVTQSQAEYTTMAFRTSPGAIVIGSTTAGADGNVSTIPLPGGQSSLISGIGVYYPDQRPTQRIGILPDVEVLPTIEGIRAGRDELVEEAIRQIRK